MPKKPKPKTRRRAIEYKSLTGRVTMLNVSGHGRGSAQLEFTVRSNRRTTTTLVVGMQSDLPGDEDNSTEPQVFAAMATVLTMAYSRSHPVQVWYTFDAHQTARAKEIQIPPE